MKIKNNKGIETLVFAMKATDKKYSISLTKGEIWALAHLTRHFTDYMFGDDRPDHGLGILSGYREANLKAVHENNLANSWDARPQYVKDLITAMGKLNRRGRKLQTAIFSEKSKDKESHE